MTTEPLTCGWLVQVASGNPEPDFPEDCYRIIPCGEAVPVDESGEPTGRHALCEDHQAAMDLSDDEYGWISEQQDGMAWS